MFIFVGGSALSVTPLSLVQWCYSVVLAALCLPFGIVVRLIPDKLFEKIYQPFSRRQVLPATDEEQQSQLRPGEDIKRKLLHSSGESVVVVSTTHNSPSKTGVGMNQDQ